MGIDKLNSVQKTTVTYTPTKYVKSDEKETVSKRDTLTLTKEAQKLLAKDKETKSKKFQSTGFMELDLMRRQIEKSNEKKNKKRVVNMSKCFRIASRISNGDKVPLKDIKYLRENAPELLNSALLFKKPNPEPKKYKTCLDKEDEEYMKQRHEDMYDVSVGADDAIILNLEA